MAEYVYGSDIPYIQYLLQMIGFFSFRIAKVDDLVGV